MNYRLFTKILSANVLFFVDKDKGNSTDSRNALSRAFAKISRYTVLSIVFDHGLSPYHLHSTMQLSSTSTGTFHCMSNCTTNSTTGIDS